MKQITICILLLLITASINAQTTEDSVKAVVKDLFTAMKNADSSALQYAFSPTAVMQTISRTKEGETVVRTESVAAFSSSISRLTRGDADERITFGAVHIDGPMASVWTPYEFYFKGNFSHCGVNSFQLVRHNGVWKIQYIIDTRRKEGCK